MSTTDDEIDTQQNTTNRIKSGKSKKEKKKEQIKLLLRQQAERKKQQEEDARLLALLQQKDNDSDDDKDEDEDDDDDDDDVDDDDDDDDDDDNRVVTATNNVTIPSIIRNNNISTEVNGNNEIIMKKHVDRLEVILPWLQSGYVWSALDPEYLDLSKKRKKSQCKTIPHDMFPDDLTITKDYGVRQFQHMHGKDKTPTETDIAETMEFISMLREQYKNYIELIIYKFWFDIASKLGLSNQRIKDNKSLVKSFQLITDQSDLYKIVYVLFLAFDYFPNYQTSIMELMEVKFQITIMKVPKLTNKRSTYHCIQKLITKVITKERKSINKNLDLAIGIQVYNTREKMASEVDENNKKKKVVHEPRQHFCIYPYMIRGTFVSNYMEPNF